MTSPSGRPVEVCQAIAGAWGSGHAPCEIILTSELTSAR